MPLAPGTTFGRYQIHSLLGVGGMGEVYRAHDTKLRRDVALKFLPAQFTTDQERLRRFENEACAASSLNHPNILTIHEIGSEDGLHFITMEFIDGVTLRQHSGQNKVSLREVLDVSIQVASALTAAHTAGIVHRDIKPENIMVRRDGYVKVLDFGLAKLTEQQTHRSDPEAATIVKTEPGMIMGTASYMSPEQARGQEVDARTDIWSLGVVIYEMITGELPFAGKTSSDVISMILQKEPLALRSHAADVPPELERIIGKALAKDYEERYQIVKDLAIDLKSLRQQLEFEAKLDRSVADKNRSITNILPITSAKIEGARSASTFEKIIGQTKHKKLIVLATIVLATVSAVVGYSYFSRTDAEPIESIAILPFTNASADPNIDYLSDGIAESLINSLSEIPKLRVVPRSTVFRYKGRDPDPQAVGRELGVRAVLTGKLIQRGDTLNIQTELVDVDRESTLWGEQYNRKVADILAIQEEISSEIFGRLRIKLSGEQRKQLTKRYTDNTEAYQLYLKGRYYWNKRTVEDLKKGIDYFRQAIDLDPNYALAHAGLADSYNVLPIWTPIETKEAYPKAKAAALHALEIDETLAEAHIALAYAQFRYDWDWLSAEREFKRGIELKPNYATAHQWYSFYLSSMGRVEEAIIEIKRAQDLEPLNLFINSDVGWMFYRAGKYDDAISQLRKTIEIDPTFSYAYYNLGLVYEQKGMYDSAITEMRKAIELSKAPGFRIPASLGHTYAVAGKRAEAVAILEQLTEEAKREHVSAYFVAVIYTGLGDRDQAFLWFEKACQNREWFMPRLKDDVRLDRIRSDPRFANLMRCVGLSS